MIHSENWSICVCFRDVTQARARRQADTHSPLYRPAIITKTRLTCARELIEIPLIRWRKFDRQLSDIQSLEERCDALGKMAVLTIRYCSSQVIKQSFLGCWQQQEGIRRVFFDPRGIWTLSSDDGRCSQCCCSQLTPNVCI